MPYEIPSSLTPKEYTELYPRYLASERSRKRSACTLKAYDLALRKFRDYLNETNPPEITPLVVQEWTDAMMDADVSSNSAGQYWDSVGRFFTWARRMKLVSESPMPEGGKPDYILAEKEIPTKEEILKLLDPKNIPFSIQKRNPRRNYTIVALLILTGLRSNELRELKVEDLNFEAQTITVKNGKGGKRRKAPFSPLAQEIVGEYIEANLRPENLSDSDYLFGTHAHGLDEETAASGEKWHKFDAATLGRLVKRYGKAVIGKEIHPHLLRHCFASLLADAGQDMREIQQALGHAQLSTTERIYTHILNQNKAAQSISKTLSTLSL